MQLASNGFGARSTMLQRWEKDPCTKPCWWISLLDVNIRFYMSYTNITDRPTSVHCIKLFRSPPWIILNKRYRKRLCFCKQLLRAQRLSSFCIDTADWFVFTAEVVPVDFITPRSPSESCPSISTARRYANAVYAVVVCLSVRLSHAGIVSKRAKRRMTETTPHDNTATI